jgi:hypothetical protein
MNYYSLYSPCCTVDLLNLCLYSFESLDQHLPSGLLWIMPQWICCLFLIQTISVYLASLWWKSDFRMLRCPKQPLNNTSQQLLASMCHVLWQYFSTGVHCEPSLQVLMSRLLHNITLANVSLNVYPFDVTFD